MKEETKGHLKFLIEMLNPIGVICLIFGTIASIKGTLTGNSSLSSFGVFLILFSVVLYEINWNHDNLKNVIENKTKNEPKETKSMSKKK